MAKQTVKDLDVTGKRVLVRVDFNVPIKEGKITNDNRIQAALPTINYLTEHGAKVILLSHLGKVDHKDPEKTEADKKKNDMAPVAARLAELVNSKVTFVPETKGAALEEAIASMNDGEIILMQNTRYEKGESKNDPELGEYWAKLGDLYVSDAFGSVHRAHASTVGIPTHLPSACGFLVGKEIDNLSAAIDNPKRPLVAILGGAKVSDKIAVIENLLNIADKVIIGGGMAYTFLNAKGYNVGTSLLEADKVELAKEFMEKSLSFWITLLVVFGCISGCSIFKYLFPYSYSMVYGITSSILATYFLVKFLKNSNAKFAYIIRCFGVFDYLVLVSNCICFSF